MTEISNVKVYDLKESVIACRNSMRLELPEYTEKKLREIIMKAYENTNSDDDEEEETTSKKSKKTEKKSKKNEPTLREKFEKLDMDELKSICLEIGMSKKEFKAFDDEEEVLDELFDNYEEDDLAELLENLEDEEEDEDEDDD